jgi:hypothetical protein
MEALLEANGITKEGLAKKAETVSHTITATP